MLTSFHGSFRRPCSTVIARLSALGIGWRFAGSRDAIRLVRFAGFDDRPCSRNVTLVVGDARAFRGRWLLRPVDVGRFRFRGNQIVCACKSERIVTESVAASRVGNVAVIVLRDSRVRRECETLIRCLGYGASVCIVNSNAIPGLVVIERRQLTVVTESVCYRDVRRHCCFSDANVITVDIME